MTEDTQRNHRELCLLYENMTANLDASKNRQWQVYLFYSAVAAFFIHINNRQYFMKIFISIVIFLGTIAVEFTQAHLRGSMLNYRRKLTNVCKAFGQPFKKIIGEKKVGLSSFEKIFRRGGFIYIFTASSYTVLSLWSKELEKIGVLKGCSMFVFFVIFAVIALLLAFLIPGFMDRYVRYIDKKHTQSANPE